MIPWAKRTNEQESLHLKRIWLEEPPTIFTRTPTSNRVHPSSCSWPSRGAARTTLQPHLLKKMLRSLASHPGLATYVANARGDREPRSRMLFLDSLGTKVELQTPRSPGRQGPAVPSHDSGNRGKHPCANSNTTLILLSAGDRVS